MRWGKKIQHTSVVNWLKAVFSNVLHLLGTPFRLVLGTKFVSNLRMRIKHADRWRVRSGSVISILVLLLFVMGLVSEPVRASQTWNQSDWSGGTGSSTSNQYSSASNIDDTSGSSIGLSAGSNLFSNPSFDTDLTDWNGFGSSYDTVNTLTGAGSSELVGSADIGAPFSASSSTAIGQSDAWRMESADFNGDGIDDVAIAGGSSYNITVALSNGDGSWTSNDFETQTQFTGYLAVADYDNDGDMDIATSTRQNTANFEVFMNDGTGTSFTKNTFTGPTGRSCGIATGDFNNDDYADLVFTCYVWGSFSVYLNNGSGGFPSRTDYSGGVNSAWGQYGLAVLDFNGDNNEDIVLATGASCKLRVLINNSGAGFNAYEEYSIDPCDGNNRAVYAVEKADLNGDQYDDIVFGYRSGATAVGGDARYVATLLGNSSATLENQANYAAENGVSSGQASLASADIDADGDDDVVAGSPDTDRYSVYLNNGDGTLAARDDIVTPDNPVDVNLGDYDGDDRPDIGVLAQSAAVYSTGVNNNGGTSLSQLVNTADTDQYVLEGYVYTDGSAVTVVDAELYANGEALSTSYSDAGSGWYKLAATVTGADELRSYGAIAKNGKTVYVDDMALYKYNSPGVITSNPFDLTFGGDWGALTYTTSGGGTVEVKVRSDSSSDMSAAADFSTCPALASGTDLTGQTCMNNNDQYVQYQVTLTYVNGEEPPVLEDINIEYSAWDTDAPTTNASNIVMLRADGGDEISSNGWSNGESPYFSWDAGADNGGGSGVKGYCLYLGATQGSDPVSTKGLLGTSPVDTNGACQFAVSSEYIDLATSGYLGSALTTSNDPYYLSIKVIDNADNVYAGSVEEFQFRFDNTKPTNPSFITAPSQFVANKEQSLTWPTSGGDEAADANSGVAGLQYRIGNSSLWYGDSHTGDEDSADLLADDGEYTTQDPPDFDNIGDGNNIIYFRTWDNAGNVSTLYATTVLKINTSSPSTPQNVTAAPSTNTTNSFAFSWAAPASYTGSASNITYCYTVNTTPTVNNCTYTAAGVTSLDAAAFATQPGENTFYVVAKDEADNINYATAGSTTFTANTSAPGIPLNLDIVDISVKTTSNWRLALSWDEPNDVGSGVASYKIMRSTDNSSFSQVASTSGTSYVDGSLTFEQDYYYKVKACDSANNCGALTSSVTDAPTGKYTEPASLTSQPKVSSISTRKATITWSTARSSDSRIQYGTKSGQYFSTEAAISDQVTAHEVPLNNLAAGTTYYAKARWTDEDGNTGSSSEFTFRTAPAPVVKEVTAKPYLTGADIRFTSKDAAKIKAYFGKSESFGGLETLNTSLSESKYTINLSGLDDGSKYFYKLNTLDADGNEYEGNVYSFTTPPRPRISNLRFQPVKDQPSSTQKVTWDTNVAANSELTYGIGRPSTTVTTQKLTTNHEVVIKGLVDDSDYVLVARSRDASGNVAVSDQQNFKTDLDTRPPKISDVVVDASIRGTGAEARGQVVVSWKTDEPASSQVAYGEGSSGFLSSTTSEDAKLTTDHVVVISDLSTSRVYHFEPRSFDKARNEAKGEQKVAIVGRASESVLSIIFNALQKIFGIE